MFFLYVMVPEIIFRYAEEFYIPGTMHPHGSQSHCPKFPRMLIHLAKYSLMGYIAHLKIQPTTIVSGLT